ncbi:MAG: hypothetical protein ACRDZ3_09405 [Acidimicrobiia bacterium]
MAYAVRPWDRNWYRTCRRAWDFGSRTRRNLEPAKPAFSVDVDRALRDALAVYYFPGMWEWDRSVVLPLTNQALERAMRQQRDPYPELTPEQNAEWEAGLETGRTLLGHYLEWAPAVDRFWPVRVETDFDVQVPDWRSPGDDLVVPGRQDAIRYQGRVDMLVVDEHDAYWMVRHRLASDGFSDHDLLVLDDELVAAAWAWEIFYLGMTVAGTIHNEMVPEATPPDPADPVRRPRASHAFARARAGHRRMYVQAEQMPSEVMVEEGGGMFRRTRIPRSRTELANLGRHLGQETLEMSSPEVVPYPTPGAHCRGCDYRRPCLALQEGDDAEPVLAEGYRTRPEEVPEEGRLGGVTWSMNRGAAPPAHWRNRR